MLKIKAKASNFYFLFVYCITDLEPKCGD